MGGSERASAARGGRSYEDSQVSDLGNWETSCSIHQGMEYREGKGLNLGQVIFKGPESHVGGDIQDTVSCLGL